MAPKVRKKPATRGGFKQQLRAEGFPLAAEVAPVTRQKGPTTGNSKLASTLLQQWCWGSLSLPQVQLLAQAAVDDGAQDSLLRL